MSKRTRPWSETKARRRRARDRATMRGRTIWWQLKSCIPRPDEDSAGITRAMVRRVHARAVSAGLIGDGKVTVTFTR